jgi:hypothetical protein
VDRENRSVNGVDVFELLADKTQREVVQTVTAEALRKADSREADGGELGEDLGVVVAGSVVGRDRRRELACAEIPDRRDELLLVRGQRKVEHGYGFFDGVGECLGDAVGFAEVVGLGVGDGPGDGTG